MSPFDCARFTDQLRPVTFLTVTGSLPRISTCRPPLFDHLLMCDLSLYPPDYAVHLADILFALIPGQVLVSQTYTA